MSRRLYHEESANIIVFLAHLCSDPIVLEEMKRTAAELFRQQAPAAFEDDVKPINALRSIDMRLSLPASSPVDNRRSEQDAKDEVLASRNPRAVDGREVKPLPDEFVQSSTGVYSLIHEIQAAKRTIQILGQVLRNGAASIPGQEKRLIVHEIFRLGRRLLGMLYEDFPAALPEWLDELKGKYRGENKDANETEAVSEAHRLIFELYWLSTLGVVVHVADSVGLALLSGTFRKVYEEEVCLANELYDLAIKLEGPGESHEKKR